MSRAKEIRVGLTVMVALAILITMIGWLSTYAKSQLMRVWRVRFAQAGGLGEGDEVSVNGLRKGSVKRMRLAGDYVVVDLALSNELTITRDSKVAIRNVGLMGEKVIAVDLRTTGEAYSTRDTIIGEYESGMAEVMAEAGKMVHSVRHIVTQLDSVSASLGSRGGLAGTLENFRQTSEELRVAVEENRAALKATLENFAASSQTVKGLTSEREGQLRETLDHFSSAAKNLDGMTMRLDSLRIAAQSVAAKLDRGEGSLGRLVNDDKLYSDLNSSVKSLRALIDDVKANPRKYFKFSVF
jgi:phospholipid/cholesterol/gamma-HCH transport system substrate-binding protein